MADVIVTKAAQKAKEAIEHAACSSSQTKRQSATQELSDSEYDERSVLLTSYCELPPADKAHTPTSSLLDRPANVPYYEAPFFLPDLTPAEANMGQRMTTWLTL